MRRKTYGFPMFYGVGKLASDVEMFEAYRTLHMYGMPVRVEFASGETRGRDRRVDAHCKAFDACIAACMTT